MMPWRMRSRRGCVMSHDCVIGPRGAPPSRKQLHIYIHTYTHVEAAQNTHVKSSTNTTPYHTHTYTDHTQSSKYNKPHHVRPEPKPAEGYVHILSPARPLSPREPLDENASLLQQPYNATRHPTNTKTRLLQHRSRRHRYAVSHPPIPIATTPHQLNRPQANKSP